MPFFCEELSFSELAKCHFLPKKKAKRNFDLILFLQKLKTTNCSFYSFLLAILTFLPKFEQFLQLSCWIQSKHKKMCFLHFLLPKNTIHKNKTQFSQLFFFHFEFLLFQLGKASFFLIKKTWFG